MPTPPSARETSLCGEPPTDPFYLSRKSKSALVPGTYDNSPRGTFFSRPRPTYKAFPTAPCKPTTTNSAHPLFHCKGSHVTQPSHSPPTASAREQLPNCARRTSGCCRHTTHALLSDRDPCSAVYVASFLGPRGGTARFLNVFWLTSGHYFLMWRFLNALT